LLPSSANASAVAAPMPFDAPVTTDMKPIIDRSFDLDKIADAFRYEASGQHFGKICLEF
jgi:NADPH:quinone reductase-like Zn-dependent oxidoreductase